MGNEVGRIGKPTGPSQAEPVVSALRASVPCAGTINARSIAKWERNKKGNDALANIIEDLCNRIDRTRHVIESGYRGVDKAELCPHERYGFEDCIACYDDALLGALDTASCDTRPKGGDVEQAPFTSGAVGEAETPNPSREDNNGLTG